MSSSALCADYYRALRVRVTESLSLPEKVCHKAYQIDDIITAKNAGFARKDDEPEIGEISSPYARITIYYLENNI